jgi:carbamate kinase
VRAISASRSSAILETVTAASWSATQAKGHFAEGSMGPKVKAALRFIAAGGKRAHHRAPRPGPDALAGKTGTHVVPG